MICFKLGRIQKRLALFPGPIPMLHAEKQVKEPRDETKKGSSEAVDLMVVSHGLIETKHCTVFVSCVLQTETIMTAYVSLNNDFTHAVGQISLTYACFVSLSMEHQPCLQNGKKKFPNQLETQTRSYINVHSITYYHIV